MEDCAGTLLCAYAPQPLFVSGQWSGLAWSLAHMMIDVVVAVGQCVRRAIEITTSTSTTSFSSQSMLYVTKSQQACVVVVVVWLGDHVVNAY